MTPGSQLLRAALSGTSLDHALDRFAPELDDYAELIVGPAEKKANDNGVLGFMTRGEGPEFTARVQQTLAELDLPPEARAHHAALAEWFDHKRAFFKIEQHPDGPLAACYFRRRPTVDEVLLRLLRQKVAPVVRNRVMEVAARLAKGTVHFVSAAFRPDQPVHQKLYFSQWVTPATAVQVTSRIASVFDLYGLGEAQAGWRARHATTVPPGESTLFLSLSFTADTLSPSFKIDYPAVGAVRAAAWLAPKDQDAVVQAIEHARPQVNAPNTTFLGVRFHPGRFEPTLKYYFDTPRPESEGR